MTNSVFQAFGGSKLFHSALQFHASSMFKGYLGLRTGEAMKTNPVCFTM